MDIEIIAATQEQLNHKIEELQVVIGKLEAAQGSLHQEADLLRSRNSSLEQHNHELNAQLDDIKQHLAIPPNIAALMQKSEEAAAKYFEESLYPMFFYDKETWAFVKVNDACIAHYGYSRAEFLAMTIKDIRPPEDIPKVLQSIQAFNNTTKPQKIWRHLKKDGTICYMDITYLPPPVLYPNLHPVLAYDVTDQALAEQRLAELNDQLEARVVARTAELEAINQKLQIETTERTQIEAALNAILNNSDQFFTLLDRDHRIIAINTLAGQQVRDKATYVGISYQDFIPVEARQNYLRSFNKALQGERVSLERYITTIFGTQSWYEFNYYPIFDENGQVSAVCINALDITKRKEAELTLQKSESTLKAILDSTTQAFLLIDLNHKILAFNRKAFRELKGKEGQPPALGLNFLENLQPEVQAYYLSSFNKAIHGERVVVERQANLPNLGQVWFEYIYSPVFDSVGGVYAICLSYQNIQQRKQAELALQKSEGTLKAIFDSTVQSFVLLDPNHHIMALNNKAQTEINHQDKSIVQVGDKFDECVNPAFRDFYYQSFAKAVLGERVVVERQTLYPSNIRHWYEYTYNPVLDEVSKVYAVCLSYQNIDQRKQGEFQMRRSAERMHALAEITQALSKVTLDYQAVLDLAVKSVAELLGGVSAIHILTAEGNSVEIAAIFNTEPELAQFMEVAKSYNRSAIPPFKKNIVQLHQFSIKELIQNLKNLPDYAYPALPLPFNLDEELVMLIAPLWEHEKLLGTLASVQLKSKVPFSAENREFLKEVADRVAIAVHNAHLHQEVKLRDQLEAVLTVARTAAHDFNQPLTVLQAELDFILELGEIPDESVFERMQEAVSRITKLVKEYQKIVRYRTTEAPVGSILNKESL